MQHKHTIKAPPPDPQSLLQALNKASSCGSEALAAAAPVRLNARLHAASAGLAEDMAPYSYFSHTGRDDFHVSERANRTGYAWRAIGENSASGRMHADLAVRGWLKSPSHYANLMMPSYTEMGLAFAVNPQSDGGVYWVQGTGIGAPQITQNLKLFGMTADTFDKLRPN